MNTSYNRFIIGTKERPTVFLVAGGEVSDFVEDAHFFNTIKDAEEEIQMLDEPELFKVYSASITILGI